MDEEPSQEPRLSEQGWFEPHPPTPPEPERPSQNGVLVALALAMVVSLAGNVLLGARLRDERDTVDRLKAQVAQQQEDLDALRGEVRGGGNGALEGIASAVARLRGLAFKATVRTEILTPEDFKDRVRKEITTQSDSTEMQATQKVLRLLGVIPQDYDLFAETLAIQEEQVAGFYDNKGDRLVVPSTDANNPSPLDREVLAHEYVHALADQHFNLNKLDALQESDRDDEAAAYVALAEGDAEAVRLLYDAQVLTEEERDEVRSSQIDTSRFSAAPRFLQDAFLFPYTEGTAFVSALRSEGGFARVNQAYRDPPRSTEQILHPDRYIDERDDPVKVTLPDLGATLGSAWKSIDVGQAGEFDLRLIGQYGGQGLSTTKANAAAGGWDGGQYEALDSKDGTLIAISTAWDSSSEANEALRVFGEWLPLRFRNVGTSFDAGPDGTGWEGDGGAGAAFRDRDRVVILVGPDRQTVERARSAF